MTVFVHAIGSSVQHLRHVGISYTEELYPDSKAPFKAMVQDLKQATKLETLSLSQELYTVGFSSWPIFRNSAEAFRELIPLLKYLNKSRKNETGKARLASEVIAFDFTTIQRPIYINQPAKAAKFEAELNLLLSETSLP